MIDRDDYGSSFVIALVVVVAILFILIATLPAPNPCDIRQPSVHQMQSCYATQTSEYKNK